MERNIFLQSITITAGMCVDRNNGEAVGSAIEAFYAELKVKSIRIQRKVDNKLPKFHVAAIPWCPAVQKYRR